MILREVLIQISADDQHLEHLQIAFSQMHHGIERHHHVRQEYDRNRSICQRTRYQLEERRSEINSSQTEYDSILQLLERGYDGRQSSQMHDQTRMHYKNAQKHCHDA